MKRALVYDSTIGRRDKHRSALEEMGYTVTCLRNGVVDFGKDDYRRIFELVLLHQNDDGECFSNLNVKGPIVFYGGNLDLTNPDRIPRSVEVSTSLTPDELRRLLDELGKPGSSVADAITAVWGGVPETLLSWTLLCTYGGDDGASVELRETLEDAALNELRNRSGDASAVLNLEDAKELIRNLRQDW